MSFLEGGKFGVSWCFFKLVCVGGGPGRLWHVRESLASAAPSPFPMMALSNAGYVLRLGLSSCGLVFAMVRTYSRGLDADVCGGIGSHLFVNLVD